MRASEATGGYGLEGRVAIVTGAAQGIGLELARGLAINGACVVVADLDAGRARAVAAKFGATGMEVDIADVHSVEALVDGVMREHGRIDVLVNNAALFSTLDTGTFTELSLDDWERVLRVNVTGVFLMCRAVAPRMIESGFGRIINMSSGAQRMGRPNYLHYIASKGAVEAMTRSLARELGAHSITVNAVLPGAIDTGVSRRTVTPEQKATIIASQCVPRGGTSQDIVSTVLHLASPASGFVTGQSFIVDGGVVHG